MRAWSLPSTRVDRGGRARICSSAATANRTGSQERGFVAAFESVALYGLTLSSRRRVNYGNVAPREAQRDLRARGAGRRPRTLARAAPEPVMVEHNRRLRHEVEQLEAKLRRRDVLVDEQTMTDFYLQRLPEQVHSTAALENGCAARIRPERCRCR